MKKMLKLKPAIAAFICMMGMGITTTGFSLFIAPVADALDVGRSTFSIYYSLMSICGAITSPFISTYVGKKGVKNVLILSCFWIAAGLLIFSYSNSVIIFYLVGFAMGLFETNFTILCANVIVQNSYEKKEIPSILGGVMAGSGVGGMIIGVVMPEIIQDLGWRNGYRVLAIIWLILRLISSILFVNELVEKEIIIKKENLEDGMTRAQAIRTPKFYILLILTVVITMCCGVQQHIPSILGEMQFSAKQLAFIISFLSAMIAVGKILLGILYSKIGIKLGGLITIFSFLVGFILLLNRETAYVAIAFIAVGLSVYTILLPLLVRQMYGNIEYASIWGLVMFVSSVTTFISNPTWGVVYDITANYNIGIIIAIILLVISIFLHMIILMKQKNEVD